MSEKDDCSVVIKVDDRKDRLVFTVSDDGCGMDYNIKQKVFTTFFTSKGGKGTGLGLLTTKKIVKEHGGDIVVKSREGEGSTFKIILPQNRLYTIYKRDYKEN